MIILNKTPNVLDGATVWAHNTARLLAFFCLVAAVTGLVTLRHARSGVCAFETGYKVTTVSMPSKKIDAVVVDTPVLLQKGLSDKPCMPQDQAMLFVFDEPDRHGFWMKDMHFAIDIVWLDGSKRVVSIASSVRPETYPEVFTPDSTSSYVIEVPAGRANAYGLGKGTQLSW